MLCFFAASTSIYHWNIEAINFPILSICFFIAGAKDDLESPSARIVVGKTVKVGTGAFKCIKSIEE